MLILCLLFVTRLDKIYKLYHDIKLCSQKYAIAIQLAHVATSRDDISSCIVAEVVSKEVFTLLRLTTHFNTFCVPVIQLVLGCDMSCNLIIICTTCLVRHTHEIKN